MKPLLITIVALLSYYLTQGQILTVSGRIKTKDPADLELYLLYAGPYTKNKAITLAMDGQVEFRQQQKLPYPVFGILKYKNAEKRILLCPGRNIDIEVSSAGNSPVFKVRGKARQENDLLESLHMENPPIFMQGEQARNPYTKMKFDALLQEVLQPMQHEIVLAEQQIFLSDIPPVLKFMLQKELRYSRQSHLYDFANRLPSSQDNIREQYTDYILALEPVPGNATLMNCPFANMMLDNYSRASINNAGKQLKNNPEAGKREIEELFHLPFDSLLSQANKYDEGYILPWLYAKYQFPPSIGDKLLFNKIMDACDNHSLSTALGLLDTLQKYFNYSQYISLATTEVRTLESVANEQTLNTKIVIHNRKVKSLADLVATYKGKWVYLDIWGTWCGPCKTEMQYMPALKKKLAGEPVIFAYLDMDDDGKVLQWQQYVRLAKLEGQHYRLNNHNIKGCWDEIAAAGGETNRYPTYVLFNPEGKIVAANAGRPSDTEKTIQQITGYMKQQQEK